MRSHLSSAYAKLDVFNGATAVAELGRRGEAARLGRGLDDRDLVPHSLELPRGGQAHDACAEHAYVHDVPSAVAGGGTVGGMAARGKCRKRHCLTYPL